MRALAKQFLIKIELYFKYKKAAFVDFLYLILCVQIVIFSRNGINNEKYLEICDNNFVGDCR